MDLLIKFLDQNNGKLSKKKREKQLEVFGDEEIMIIEETFQNIFWMNNSLLSIIILGFKVQ